MSKLRTTKHGLRFEIIVSLAILVAAAVGLVGVVVFKFTQKEMITLKIESGLLLARIIEERIISSPKGSSLSALISTLTQTGFEGIVVINKFGNIQASSSNWSWENRPSRTELMEAMITRQQKTFFAGDSLFFFGRDPSLAMAVPLYDGTKLVGAAGIYSPLKDLKASWSRTRMIVIYYLGLDTLIMVVFGTYLLTLRLIRPLKGMLERVKALADGEYSPDDEPVYGTGEIGELEESFEIMARNLTESRVRLEDNIESLKQAQGHLVKSEKMATVGRLAAGLAHELGNPLGAVKGFVHLLQRQEFEPEERDEFLVRAMTELDRMDAIIRALLDFARPAKTETGPVDLNELLLNVHELAKVQDWGQGIEFEKKFQPDIPKAKAEINNLTQVLLNLMSNAGQAMENHGLMKIGTGRENDELFFYVADSGVGISEEDLGKIFEPFFSRKAPGKGTGLGLSVSQSIIESFGGRITVESRIGQGSRFTVFLPLYN